MQFLCTSVRWERHFKCPKHKVGRFHFQSIFAVLGAIKNSTTTGSRRDCDNLQITQSSFLHFAFAFSKPSPPSRLGPIIAHRPPIHANPPPLVFFLVQPRHLPVSALRSACSPSRARIIAGPEPAHAHGGLGARWWRSLQPLTPRRNSRHKPALSPLPLPSRPYRQWKGPILHHTSHPALWPGCA